MADPLLFSGKCIQKLSRSCKQAHDEITAVAPDAKDTHGTHGNLMFLYTLGLKERAVWNGMLGKKSENQLYSHTSPYYDRAALQKAPTLKSHYCRNSEDTHMHARKMENLLSAPKHFPDCSIKHFIFAPWKDQCDQ